MTIRYSNYIGGVGNPAPRTESLVVNGTTTQVTLADDLELGRLVHRHRSGHPDRRHQHRRPRLRKQRQLQRQHRRHRGHRPRRDRRAVPARQPARRLHPLLRLRQRQLLRIAGLRQRPVRRDLHGKHPADGQPGSSTSPAGTCSTTPRPPSGPRPAGSPTARRATSRTATCSATARTTRAPCGPGQAHRPGAATRRNHLRHLVLPVLPVLDRELSEARSSRSSKPTASPSTTSRSTPTGRARAPGTAGNGTPASSPTPPRSTDWAASEDIHVALNVHPSIANNDPLYAQAQDVAGNTLSDNGTQAVWDWGNVAQAESYFDTADPTQNAVGETWLDWCCDASERVRPQASPPTPGSTT